MAIEIPTPWGNTTESQRLQAALNIKADPEVRKRVLELLVRECGSIAKAEVEMKRRYPEAFQEEEL